MAEQKALFIHLAHRAHGHHAGVLHRLFLGLGGLELLLQKELQILQQLVCALVALVDVGAHGLERDALQLRRHVLDQFMGRYKVCAEVLDGDLADGLALVGLFGREHLVHHDAERVDVAAGVGKLSPRLLGRDIVDGADGLAVILVDLVFQGRDAEILHLHGAVAQHHDVLGFDVPVDDAALMGVGKRAGDLPRKVQHLPPLQRAAPVHVLPQRDPVYQFHDYVFDFIAVADIIHGHDIRVGEHGDGVGLGAEGTAEFLVRRHLLAHDLHRHAAVESQVLRLVHDRHAALADQLLDFVAIVKDLADKLVLVVHKDLRLAVSA